MTFSVSLEASKQSLGEGFLSQKRCSLHDYFLDFQGKNIRFQMVKYLEGELNIYILLTILSYYRDFGTWKQLNQTI